MPDVVPYLDEDGNKKYMPSRDYIKKELEKELTVRDDIAATLSDHSKDGLIPQFVKTVNEMHESKDIRHKARSVDKHTQNEYNDSKIFTQTNEFLREVPSESRGDFSRSLANQTSNLLDGEAKLISINAAGKVYYFLAEGYMNGRIISTSTTNIHKLKERDGYANGIKSDRKNPHRWIERVSNLGGESKSDLYLLEERGRAIRDDQIFDDASRSNRTGDTKRSGENSYTEEEIDRIVKRLKDLYGLNEDNAIRHKARTTDNLGNELTDAQSEYFKDSKIRDSKGNLMVLYHGTTADFNVFKKGDVGYHFGTKSAARGRVGYGKNVTLKEVYLNITNPIAFDEDLGSWDADYRLTEELYNRGIITQEEAESVLLTDSKQYRRTTEQANKKLASLLLDKGYDGIEYTNTHETQKPTTSYIVFDSNQAKLTSNVNPTSDRDIRHKARTTVTTESTPYVSPTASSIVTEIDSGYDYTKWDKVSTAYITTQIMLTNAQAGIEHRGRKYGVKNIESLVQAARTASNQAQEMLSGNQIRINGCQSRGKALPAGKKATAKNTPSENSS